MKFRIPTFLIFLVMSLSLLGSRGSSPTFSPHFQEKKRKLDPIWKKGQFEKGLIDFRIAAEDAKNAGFIRDELYFLHNLGGCQFGMFQFRAALKTMIEEREIATRIQDHSILAVLGSNMSALYEQMGNLPEAEAAATEGLKDADELKPEKRALLFGQLGVIQAKQGQQGKADRSFWEAIMNARQADDKGAEAMIWDQLAYAELQSGRLRQAEGAASFGLRLGQDPKVGGLDSSYMILGEIRAQQGDLRTALRLMNKAEEELHQPLSRTPPWWIYMRRGQIQIQARAYRDALSDLRMAVDQAREWRVDVPANDANRTGSEGLLAELYQSLAEAGNHLYLETHQPELLREAFNAAEENRAASLRALLPQEDDWRKKLPQHYYELLVNLQYAQAAQMRAGESSLSPEVLKLRSDLSDIESSVGAVYSHREGRALDQAQSRLDKESVLFSFQLGDVGSWIWVVTKDSIALHSLPSRGDLAKKIVAFGQAVRSDTATVGPMGKDLYQTLFGHLDQQIRTKKRWVLTLDGPLFDLPFPALSPTAGRFLIQDHSLQIIPGALMLRNSGHQGAIHGAFLAVGDPIYNLADARTRGNRPSPWQAMFSRVTYEKEPAFARLWGTAREIEVSARAWNSPSTTILTGKQASPEKFWNKVQTKPDIIHLATHVLEENEKPQTGWIAFSLGGDGKVQYVTPEDILAKTVSARLVVLSGCSSGKADIRPATGLMGLTRAWLAAGAGSVMATRWPTVDDDGAFFESFYRNLQQSEDFNPAAALQTSSIDMLNSGTWRAKPSFWAGYFLMGNY